MKKVKAKIVNLPFLEENVSDVLNELHTGMFKEELLRTAKQLEKTDDEEELYELGVRLCALGLITAARYNPTIREFLLILEDDSHDTRGAG